MKKPTLLIVEDNETHRYVMRQLCELFDYEPLFVQNGEDALQALTLTQVSAVLVDLNLPGIDGLETVRRMRTTEAKTGKRVPIVAVTASVNSDDRQNCIDAGFDDYLSKPFLPDDFRKLLLRWTYEPKKPNLRLLEQPPSDQKKSSQK